MSGYAEGASLNSGPSARQLYDSHGGHTNPNGIDTGMAQGAKMLNQELAARAVHAAPMQSGRLTLSRPDVQNSRRETVEQVINKENYNLAEDYAVKRDIHTPFKEHFPQSSKAFLPVFF